MSAWNKTDEVDLRQQASVVYGERLTYDAWALNVLAEHGLTYDIADLRTPIADYLRTVLAERDEARADAVTNGQAAEQLSGELEAVRGALGESLDSSDAGLDGDIRLVLAQRDDARRVLEHVATERGEAWAEVVKLGGTLARARHELDLWRVAFGETALADATDRLRAALDEERIEPDHCTTCIRGCLPGPCPSAVEERTEKPHARFHAFKTSSYAPDRCRLCAGTRGEHLGDATTSPHIETEGTD